MKKLKLFIVCTFFSTVLFAQENIPSPLYPEIVSPFLSSIGGGFAALEAGFENLFTNPACFALSSREMAVSRISIRTSKPVFDVLKNIKNDDRVRNISQVIADNSGFYSDLSITGPISFGLTSRNFGFGFFNNTRFIVAATALSSLEVFLGEDFLLLGGYGGRVYDKDGHIVALGVQLKGFFLTYSYLNGTIPQITHDISNFKMRTVPVFLETGFGIDVGFLYKYKTIFSLGITCKDVYTPVFMNKYMNYIAYFKAVPSGKTHYTTFFPNLTLGIALNAFPKDYFKTISSWTFYLDYRNMLEPARTIYRNPLLNLAAGMEMIFHEVVSLRAGVQDCYPHAGLGLNFTYFQMEISAYGKELGLDPGKRPLFNFELAFLFKY